MLTALKAHSRSHILAAWIFTWLALAACHLLDDPEPTPTPAPTATATPVKIRLGKESAEAWQNIPPGTDAARPGETPERPSGSAGFSRYVFEQVGDSVLATLVEGPRAGQVRVPASYQQLKERHEAGGPTDDLHMAGDELEALVHQLDVVRESTERYRDIDTALADGYAQSTEEVPNMGAHFVHPWRALDGIFDPSRPEILLYTKDENDEWELVGTSFVQPLNMAGPDHPDAFAGPLDNWHIHYELCTNTERTSRSSTEQECREEGGTWVPVYGWMIHAWVWVDNPLGVFNMWNPNIAPIACGIGTRVRVDRFRDLDGAAAASSPSQNATIDRPRPSRWSDTHADNFTPPRVQFLPQSPRTGRSHRYTRFLDASPREGRVPSCCPDASYPCK